MPSWFDIHDTPITSVILDDTTFANGSDYLKTSLVLQHFSNCSMICLKSFFVFSGCKFTHVQKSVKDEEDVLRGVQSVHAIIDREIAAGTDPEEICVFGLSQGGIGREPFALRGLCFLPSPLLL
jgi:hypothetical protein